MCQSSLGNDSQALKVKWTEAYTLSQDVLGIQEQDIILQVSPRPMYFAVSNLSAVSEIVKRPRLVIFFAIPQHNEKVVF